MSQGVRYKDDFTRAAHKDSATEVSPLGRLYKDSATEVTTHKTADGLLQAVADDGDLEVCVVEGVCVVEAELWSLYMNGVVIAGNDSGDREAAVGG